MSESMNNEFAKVYENDNGQFISVTKEMLEKADMKIGDELIVNVKPNQIIVEKPNSYKE
ncbi:AbrB/MazE/SpoVT family DNA-binding domain-containing protein [Mammaliicoccus sciuri]|uniref:AbrB/MazE/SpoVT family DNA-binding domain-containing protein n=1 Tax=Mammaliicoccus sciuri TaxID=1296 RepID=UPI001FB240C6|nr:AbrB/MazE/SpoVT family DNA-binding domain-containing protein [Mammaliicoccus sciuri]MCJ1778168.1 AbrB/MazE/SpoVT family DNA-binding domain-containing protein [Mammaliicoccus sciuri]